jgi:hypothetical protein
LIIPVDSVDDLNQSFLEKLFGHYPEKPAKRLLHITLRFTLFSSLSSHTLLWSSLYLLKPAKLLLHISLSLLSLS